MSSRIDYYFSFPSPWAHIGHAAFEDVARTYGCTISYKPVMLGDLFAETGGLPLAKRHPVRQRYRLIELQRWREKRGLSFSLHPKYWPFDPKRSDGMALAVIEAGHNVEPFMRLVFKSIWEKDLNLDDPATLVQLADACGLPGTSCSIGRALPKSLKPTSGTARTRSPLVCSVRPDSSSMANHSGGRIEFELLADALKSGRAPYRSDV